MTPDSLDQWWSEGRTLPVKMAGGTQEVFIRMRGTGPAVTLLHGFPASSYEWAPISETPDSTGRPCI